MGETIRDNTMNFIKRNFIEIMIGLIVLMFLVWIGTMYYIWDETIQEIKDYDTNLLIAWSTILTWVVCSDRSRCECKCKGCKK